MYKRSTSQQVSTPAPDALRTAGKSARRNGAELLKDARLLFDADRYPRSAALAILAEEEFLKAFILDNASGQGRWDQALFDALRFHGTKLGLAEGLRDMAATLRVSGLSEQGLDALASKTRSLIPGNQRNLFKQQAFYVDIGPDGEHVSTPSQVTREEASACLEAASEMYDVVMQQISGLATVVGPGR